MPKYNIANLKKTETLEEELSKTFVHDSYMQRSSADLGTSILIQQIFLRDGYVILKIENNPSQFSEEISQSKLVMLKDFKRKNNVRVQPIFDNFETVTEDGGETYM